MHVLLLTFFLFFSSPLDSISGIINDHKQKVKMVAMVNKIRISGCKCGSKRMKPVEPIRWSDRLYKSAYEHAKDMKKRKYFSHHSKSGLSLGERIGKIADYDWKEVGENIGEGQRSFNEVFKDWLKSPSHCKMMMNPKVDEMAVAKSGKYWVQHFGKEFRKKNQR